MTNDKIGCVVVSIRNHKETLILDTEQGQIVIEIEPVSNVRSKVVVRAPRSVIVSRKKRIEAEVL